MSRPTRRRRGASARGEEAVDLARGTDFVAASGVQAERAELADAELVFVGYGIEAPEYGWDDFKGRRRARQGARRAEQRSGLGSGSVRRHERLYYGRWIYKYESAARQGAAGVIIIHTTPSAGYPWQVVQSSWSGPQYELPAGDEPRSCRSKAWVTEDAARRLLGPGQQSRRR